MKKELAELKTARFKEGHAQGASGQMALLPPQAAFESLEAIITPDAMELNMEKQAHQETFAALDASEQSVQHFPLLFLLNPHLFFAFTLFTMYRQNIGKSSYPLNNY